MERLKQLAINDEGFIFDPSTGESFTTNKTGLFILNLLKEGKSQEEIVESLVSEYSVDRETAERDVIDFLERLRSYNILPKGEENGD